MSSPRHCKKVHVPGLLSLTISLLLHHPICRLQQKLLLHPFPSGLLSCNSRQACIGQALYILICTVFFNTIVYCIGQAISWADRMEPVPMWERLEYQSLPRLNLCQGLVVHGTGNLNSRFKEGEKSGFGQGGRGAVSGQHYGTSCRKLRQALESLAFCKAILCPDSASYHETKFYMSPFLLYSQLCSGITSLDTLSKAICTQYRWSTGFLHGQALFFISCKQWK